jgi:protein subunit release factor A
MKYLRAQFYEMAMAEQTVNIAESRKLQVGTGGRSER